MENAMLVKLNLNKGYAMLENMFSFAITFVLEKFIKSAVVLNET